MMRIPASEIRTGDIMKVAGQDMRVINYVKNDVTKKVELRITPKNPSGRIFNLGFLYTEVLEIYR